jgi:hypothetical protein
MDQTDYNGFMTATLRSFTVFALLLIGVFIVYLPNLTPAFWGQYVSAQGEGYTYIADLDFWHRTDREQRVVAQARFDLASDLRNVPLVLGGWHGVEAPETNQEVMILLEPEQYVQRYYQDAAGRYLWLTLIGGRSSQPFHPPDICYEVDGWQYNFRSHVITLNDQSRLFGYALDARKTMPETGRQREHVVYYFYLFPDPQRRLSDGIVLFKLTSSIYGSIEETLEMQADFVRHLFTSAY